MDLEIFYCLRFVDCIMPAHQISVCQGCRIGHRCHLRRNRVIPTFPDSSLKCELLKGCAIGVFDYQWVSIRGGAVKEWTLRTHVYVLKRGAAQEFRLGMVL